MVFASLVVVGLSTLLQVKRVGPVGAGVPSPHVHRGRIHPLLHHSSLRGWSSGAHHAGVGVRHSAAHHLQVALHPAPRRNPTVGGMSSSSCQSRLRPLCSSYSTTQHRRTQLQRLCRHWQTLAVVAAITLRGAALLRLWGPVIGIVAGTAVAAAMGAYDVTRVLDASWVGVPASAPGLALDFGITFWTLLPSFLFLGVIFSIHSNGESIALQRVAWREDRAIDFREVQGALAGQRGQQRDGRPRRNSAQHHQLRHSVVRADDGRCVAHRGVQHRPHDSGAGVYAQFSSLFSTIPGPVMAGYLMLVCGTLFVDGARTIILNEPNREKVVAGGICFWIGAAFQFGLITLPDVGPVLGGLFKSGITTGGFAAIVMILYLELTNPGECVFSRA